MREHQDAEPIRLLRDVLQETAMEAAPVSTNQQPSARSIGSPQLILLPLANPTEALPHCCLHWNLPSVQAPAYMGTLVSASADVRMNAHNSKTRPLSRGHAGSRCGTMSSESLRSQLLSVRLMDPAIPTREHASLGAVPWRGPSAGSIICQDDGHGQRTLPEVQSGIQENGYCCPGPGPCDRAGAFQSSRWRADHVRAVLFWMLRI
jgi:hypothetical protein